MVELRKHSSIGPNPVDQGALGLGLPSARGQTARSRGGWVGEDDVFNNSTIKTTFKGKIGTFINLLGLIPLNKHI